jgi:signal transduction histidine kinase
MPTTNLHVFLCHSSQDKPAVRELYHKLSAEGWIDVWFDEKNLLPGQDWEYEIEKALDESDAVIVCLSRNSVTKEGFVQKELKFVIDIALEKPEGTIYILPVRLDNYSPPRRLRSYHYVDYFDENKIQGFAGLINALKVKLDKKISNEVHANASKGTNDDIGEKLIIVANENAELKKELRLALEETARLQNAVAEVESKKLESVNPFHSEQVEIVASVSQELRQPMSSIIGYTDLLLGESVGILGALQHKFVERIKASTERLASLIDDLIQVLTVGSDLLEIKAEPIDLKIIIDNAISYTSSLFHEKDISLHLDLPKKLLPTYADRDALQQVVIHLLQNAGTISRLKGEVQLKAEAKMENGESFIIIQVTDSGGGIADEDLPHVLTRSFRTNRTPIQVVGDQGVGLALTTVLVNAQKGRIWVESETGIGATFNVLIPTLNPNDSNKDK